VLDLIGEKFNSTLLYARVDLLFQNENKADDTATHDDYYLSELELIEPSLYLHAASDDESYNTVATAFHNFALDLIKK
jgi:hypothetical protein